MGVVATRASAATTACALGELQSQLVYKSGRKRAHTNCRLQIVNFLFWTPNSWLCSLSFDSFRPNPRNYNSQLLSESVSRGYPAGLSTCTPAPAPRPPAFRHPLPAGLIGLVTRPSGAGHSSRVPSNRASSELSGFNYCTHSAAYCSFPFGRPFGRGPLAAL